MVQRGSYNNETDVPLNGVPNGSRERGTSAVVIATDTVLARGGYNSGTRSLTRIGDDRFSLFRWFKRNRDSTVEKRRRTNTRVAGDDVVRRRSVYSSVESVDSFYSTTTVRSFAFHTGTLGHCNVLSFDILKQADDVGPFAAGASKLTVANKENDASGFSCTLPTNVHSRRGNITTRYSLHPSTTFGSCKHFPTSDKELTSSLGRFSERTENNSCNNTVRKRAHVKGKRRAPNPPNTVIKIVGVDVREISKNSNRRKRRAPRPPEKATDNRFTEEQSKIIDGGMDVEERKNVKDRQSISNDTLILQRGILLSKKEISNSPKVQKDVNSDLGASTLSQETVQSPVGFLNTTMPRPWYKRSVFEHSRDSGSSKKNAAFHTTTNSISMKEQCIGTSGTSHSADASLSRLNFFHRSERQNEDKKRELKRKSGLSILTNISELDKEAAAIVQEEQARTRESMLLRTSRFTDVFDKKNDINEEIVQDMVTSAMENSSPRRGTRALISKFNAISNITKVTINANFFARKDQSGYKSDRDAVRNNRLQQIRDCKDQTKFSIQQDLEQNIRVSKDISKYFLPHQKTSKSKIGMTHADIKSADIRITSSKEQNDQLMKDTSTRISVLQSQLAANRMNESLNAPKNLMPQEIDENIGLRQEIIGKEKEKNSPRLNKEMNRRHLLSHAHNRTENIENTLSSFTGKIKEKTDHTEGIQKEFSDIFDEIDRQLRSRQFKLIEQRPFVESENIRDKVPQNETAAPSKLTQALDILMETEKDDKTAPVIQVERSIRDKERLIDSGQRTKSSKTKQINLNTVEDSTTTDLKEMLKEMKHSLPKRLKPKKSTLNDIDVLEKVEKRSLLPSNKTYVASVSTRTEILSDDYETDKQKVSSAVQTSGNIRRLNQPSTFCEQPSTSNWKQEDVLYETSGKGSGLVKNTFQLIRPRDFAEIEAMKTTKKVYKENVYANVIETSLYANAPYSPKQGQDLIQSKNISQNNHAKLLSNTANEFGISSIENKLAEEAADNSMTKDMNTLAINRLLRKLEGAIASGHHQQAAGLAKELARLKIHCSVIRQRSTARLKDQSIKVNMYIEDKLAHQGPIPLQLPTRMTVAELKTKIHTEFEIPTNVQRWIIGKNLADRDEVTLNELQAVDGVPIFLYLVAPELQVDEATQTNKPQSAKDETSEKLQQSSPVDTLEIIEDQVTREMHELTSTIHTPQEEIVETDLLEDVKMERYEELILLENCAIIPNSEPIECPICFVTYGPREGIILRDCLHMFCRSCIANTVAYCDEAEVKCPYRDAEYTCESTLQEREIKALVEPGIYQQHLAKSIAQAEKNAGNKAFHCKTPDCPGWCIYDDGVNNFLCPVCGANNCLTCQVVHIGKNCKQYQQELLFSKETDQESKRTAEVLKEMVDTGEAIVCPTCAVVLIKKWGCDWLLCSMCKTEICWVTRGPRWGPGGKGDTSGGCRCGENGIKCHPQCNYCH